MKILVLDLDTLRPDHLGCYGYPRNTSPNIDRIAAQGVRFTNYYCPDAPCLPSRAALVTGRFGIHTGVVGHDKTNADLRIEGTNRGFQSRMNRQGLWATINNAGFHTASISPFAKRHGAFWFNAGFTETYDTGKGGGESAEEITPHVLDWIERRGADDNWLLHVNYWDPHTSYRAPEEFGNPFKDEPIPEWLTREVLEKHRNMVGPHCAHELMMYHNRENPDRPRQPGQIADMDDMRRNIDGYDCGIAYMDQHIGRLLDALEAKGALDDLIIIVTSDHGENQGELGIYGEHGTADHITCRIPMIIRWPGAGYEPGSADHGLRYNLDLLPTLAEMFDQPAGETWDGQSYASVLRGRQDAGREYLVLSQCAHVCQRGVRWGDWLYMRTYHDGFHLFDNEMLFNLAEDPHEQNNLAPTRRDLCMEGAYYLQQWHDEMMDSQIDGYYVDPMRQVLAEGGPCHAAGKLKDYCKFLEQTGRGWAIPELKKRHPREFE